METPPKGYCVVTGSTSGIGLAITAYLLKNGYGVYGLGREPGKLGPEITEHEQFRFLTFDQSDSASIVNVAEQICVTTKTLVGLVHCGGLYSGDTVLSISDTGFDQMFATNVRGPIRLTQELLGLLQKSETGSASVVFMNSSSGTSVRPDIALFSASQFALRALADCLRVEINHLGIRVLSIFPGRTATPRTAELFNQEQIDYDPDLLLQPENLAQLVHTALQLPRTVEITELSVRPAIKSY